MANANHKYTMVAAKALSLAELFAASFGKGLSGPQMAYRVELSTPDGPSTSGGKQALQHIKLVPADGGPTVVIGSADTARGVVEVRTFEHIAALHAQRFRGAVIPVDPNQYGELTKELSTFFRHMHMQVSFADLAPDGLTARRSVRPAQTSSGLSGWLLAGLGGVVGFIVVGAAYYFIFLR